jgi:hypothetical protein
MNSPYKERPAIYTQPEDKTNNLNNLNNMNDTYLKTCNLYDFDLSQSKNFKNSQYIMNFFDTNQSEEKLLSEILKLKSTKRINNRNSVKIQGLIHPHDIVREIKNQSQTTNKFNFSQVRERLVTDHSQKLFPSLSKSPSLLHKSPETNRVKNRNLNYKLETVNNPERVLITESNINLTHRKIALHTINSKKVTELAHLISQNRHFTENMLQNFISTCERYKEIYQEMKNYFHSEVYQFNSEVKQINFFHLIIEKFENLINERYLKKSHANIKLSQVERYNSLNLILDALFLDFDFHLSLTSNARADFLRKLMKIKKDLKEETENVYNLHLTNSSSQVESLNRELRDLKETISKQEHEIGKSEKIFYSMNRDKIELAKKLEEREYELEVTKKIMKEKESELSTLRMSLNSLLVKAHKKEKIARSATLKITKKRRGGLQAYKEEKSENSEKKQTTQTSIKKISKMNSKLTPSKGTNSLHKFLATNLSKLLSSHSINNDQESKGLNQIQNANSELSEENESIINTSESSDEDEEESQFKIVDGSLNAPLNNSARIFDMIELVKTRQKRQEILNGIEIYKISQKNLDLFLKRKKKQALINKAKLVNGHHAKDNSSDLKLNFSGTNNNDNTESNKDESQIKIEKKASSFKNSNTIKNPVNMKNLLNTQMDKVDQTIKTIRIDHIDQMNKKTVKFEKYLNKGQNLESEMMTQSTIGVQTEISSLNYDVILEKEMKGCEDNSSGMRKQLKSLNEIFMKLSSHNDNISLGNTTKLTNKAQELTQLNQSLNESNEVLMKNIKVLLSHCDLIIKDNDNLRDKVQSLTVNRDELKEIYSEIFEALIKRIYETNEELFSLCKEIEENANLTNGNVGNPPVIANLLDSVDSLLEKNFAVVEVNKNTVFELMQTYEIKRKLQRNKSSTNQADLRNNNPANTYNINNIVPPLSPKSLENNYLKKTYQKSKDLIKEFFYIKNTGKIKLVLNGKKTLKIIDTILFEWIEKIYFKKDKLNFGENQEKFENILVSDIPLIYFNHHFGLESIARKKYFEFLLAVKKHSKTHKRINLFANLLKLMKVGETIEENSILFNNFIIKNIVLLIQHLKYNSLMVKPFNYEEDLEKLHLAIYYTKLGEVASHLLQKLPNEEENKSKLSSFIEKNKYTFAINMRNYFVVDFDSFVDFYIKILHEVKEKYEILTESIFCSVNIEGKSNFDLLDFILVKQYLMRKSLSLINSSNNFNNVLSIKEAVFQDNEQVDLEYLKNLVLDYELIDEKYIIEFLKISEEEISGVIMDLSMQLRQGSINIFDKIIKRLKSIKQPNERENIYGYVSKPNEVLMEKVEALKVRVLELSEEEDSTVLWTSLRLFDEVSRDLYVENKVTDIFSECARLYEVCDQFVNKEKNSENLIVRLILFGNSLVI